MSDSELSAEARTVVPVDAETAWRAWTDPDRLTGWFVDRATGTASKPDDRMRWAWDDFGLEFDVHVTRAEAARRLVLAAPGPGPTPVVMDVRFEPAAGGTAVHVRQTGFAPGADAHVAAARSGWVLALALLKHAVAHRAGTPRHGVLALSETTARPEDVHAQFEHDAAREAWLAPLRTGAVLADSGHEVAAAWTDVDGVLELKCFPTGPDAHAVALRGHAWGASAARVRDHAQSLRDALERLDHALALHP